MQSLSLYGKALLCLALIARVSSHHLNAVEFTKFALEVEASVAATSTYTLKTNNNQYFSSNSADAVGKAF